MQPLRFDADGVRLFAAQQDEGPPLVLLHGGGATHHAVLPIASQIAGYHVITPDLRGSGRSWCGEPLSWRRLGDDVAALLDHIGADKAVVGGPSFGAAVALSFALAHPDRTAALVMITPAYGGADMGLTAFQGAQLAGLDQAVAQAGEFAGLRSFYQASPAMLAYFDANVGDWDFASFRATAAFMASGAQPFAKAADLAALRCPTLLIEGADAMHPPEVSSRLAAAIPGCTRLPTPEVADFAAAGRAVADSIVQFCADHAAW
jgi:3-oxoadipate enol-lactonase